MPADPRPSLAHAAEEAPDGPDWVHEIKYDGYRLLARTSAERCGSRPERARLNRKISDARPAFAALPVDAAVIDGELVHIEADGTTDSGHLQDAIATGRTEALVSARSTCCISTAGI